ncbi:hypothetical protein NQ315_003221 [Exocentrus adspersus]|uniref:YqaJ viral recombinase domain-containing protein n=1 Tax=Exocentrus adspersus TaxID=1586481 RepID=A0AAV8VML2_9CUCU|nr:hypothetical protein NQ315_003221 [Exocentrus adspersus]
MPSSKSGGVHGHKVLRRFGLDDKQGEVFDGSQKMYGVFRSPLEYRSRLDIITGQKNHFFEGGFDSPCQSSEVELAICKKNSGQIEFRDLRNSIGEAPLQTIAARQQSPSVHTSKQIVSDACRGDDGSEVVVATSNPLDATVPKESGSLPNNGCVRSGLGSADWGSSDQAHLETPSTAMACQSKRAVCSLQGSPTVRPLVAGKIHTASIRQSDGHSIHKESRRYPVGNISQDDFAPFDVGSRDVHHSLSSFHSRDLQRRRRQSISESGSGGLASIRSRDTADLPEMGNTSNRSFRNSSVTSGSSICVEGCQGFISPLYRRLQQGLGFSAGMGVPSTLPDSQGSVPPQLGERVVYTDSSTVGESILATGFEDSSASSSLSYSQPPTPSRRCSDPLTSGSRHRPSFGGLEGTGWGKCVETWPQADRNLLESAWRKSSLKTYAAPWTQWVTWSRSQGISFDNPDPMILARYLGYIHRIKKLALSTIKLHKSVITTFANPVEGESLSRHPVVKHMLKAIDLGRPVSDKSFVWSVDTLMDWMKRSPPDEQSLFHVSRRVALILLLASGRRIHDLTLLRINPENMTQEDGAVSFWPVFGSKTDKSSRRQSGWKLSQMADKALDPVYWIKRLIDLSANRRKARLDLFSLFITTQGSVAPASRAIIAGWVKTAFAEAGIGTPPGSIRSAVASSRSCLGLTPLKSLTTSTVLQRNLRHGQLPICRLRPCAVEETRRAVRRGEKDELCGMTGMKSIEPRTMSQKGFVKATSNNLPTIDIFMVTDFLKRDDRFNVGEMRGTKAASAIRESYGDNAIGYVELKREGPICVVQARICPEHKVRSKAYSVIVETNEEEERVTDIKCNDQQQVDVNMPLHFLCGFIGEVKILLLQRATKHVNTRSVNLPDNNSFFEELLGAAKKAKIDSQISKYNFETQLNEFDSLSIHKLLHQFKNNGGFTYRNFMQFSTHEMSHEVIKLAESRTRNQSTSSLWHELRYGRITASKIYEAAHCQTVEGALIDSIIGSRKVKQTKAMARGINLEKSVIVAVEEKLHMKLKPCGIILIKRYPIFGASPDAITDEFVVEIKCPTKEKTVTNYIKNNQIVNKYKAQIHLQMLATEKKKGLFCVADPNFEVTGNA